MINIPFQEASGSLITVTEDATLLADLINTAQGTNVLPFPWGDSSANGIDIYPEGGDIHVFYDGNIPTSTLGVVIKDGGYAQLRSVDLTQLRLIVTADFAVSCRITIGKSFANEPTMFSSPTTSATVAINGLVPGTAANELGKQIDQVVPANAVGVAPLSERRDTLTTLSQAVGRFTSFLADSRGAIWGTLATLISGEDQTANVMKVEQQFVYTNITTATTTVVDNSSGLLSAIVINKPIAAANTTIYDNTAGSGTKIGTITLGATVLSDAGKTITYNVKYNTGLTIVTDQAVDLTIVTRP